MTWFSLFACYFSKVIFFIIFTPCCLSCFDQCSQWHVFCRRKRCLCTILHEKLTMFWVFFSHSKNITNSFTSLFLFLIKMSRKRGKDLILEVHFWFLKPSLIILYCWHLLHRFPDCSSLCTNTSTFIAQFKFYEDSSENPKLQLNGYLENCTLYKFEHNFHWWSPLVKVTSLSKSARSEFQVNDAVFWKVQSCLAAMKMTYIAYKVIILPVTMLISALRDRTRQLGSKLAGHQCLPIIYSYYMSDLGMLGLNRDT